MTLMLASVADADEALLVMRGGADIVDLKDPRRGAIGAIDLEVASLCVHAVGAATRISATLGDPPYDPQALAARAHALAGLGVETLKLALDRASLDKLGPSLAALARDVNLIGMLFADEAPDFDLIPELAKLGFSGAMLDTRRKGAGRLLTHLDVARLEDFCARCRAAGLTAGLAGALEAPDIPRLLLVSPDVLGFRGALCANRDRAARIDGGAVALVRDLIPRVTGADAGAEDANWRLLGRGLVVAPETEDEFDRIFVRDFVIEADIGAYDFERGRRQRVAFDVEALVRRVGGELSDMRAIFSYDVILDAIRIVAAQGHHEFVETFAESVAAIVLRHERAREVKIVARKLDVIEGAVGVEMVRRRVGSVASPLPLPITKRRTGG